MLQYYICLGLGLVLFYISCSVHEVTASSASARASTIGQYGERTNQLALTQLSVLARISIKTEATRHNCRFGERGDTLCGSAERDVGRWP